MEIQDQELKMALVHLVREITELVKYFRKKLEKEEKKHAKD